MLRSSNLLADLCTLSQLWTVEIAWASIYIMQTKCLLKSHSEWKSHTDKLHTLSLIKVAYCHEILLTLAAPYYMSPHVKELDTVTFPPHFLQLPQFVKFPLVWWHVTEIDKGTMLEMSGSKGVHVDHLSPAYHQLNEKRRDVGENALHPVCKQ